jgi:hypothetical protein
VGIRLPRALLENRLLRCLVVAIDLVGGDVLDAVVDGERGLCDLLGRRGGHDGVRESGGGRSTRGGSTGLP